ncbi:hypothetical protein LOD99_7579 [Oopsacas minuta]|uniref:WW domain-containing protein n=1 Tax=Oopsacas minuta TaxID=111878 RepID=A0AAV7JPA5_9METZ|nr:hypothetical protein LOD99_7579 [Oopsacas minuta]
MSFMWHLPSNWSVKVDPRTSWPFYLDHKHQFTTWQDPRFKRFILFSQYEQLKGETHETNSSYTQDQDDRNITSIITVRNDIDLYFGRLITDPDIIMGKFIQKEIEEYCTKKLLDLDALELNTNVQSRLLRKKTINYIQSLSSVVDIILAS